MKFGFKLCLIPVLLLSASRIFCDPARPSFYEEILSRKPKAQICAGELCLLGTNAYENGRWNEAIKCYRTLAFYYPKDISAKNVWFYIGVSYFEMGEYEKACEAFDKHLESEEASYFDAVIDYKFYIAEQYRTGLKKRPFGLKHVPRFAPSGDAALELYDNIIEIAPLSEAAAKSLFSKGCILRQGREFREAIETFNLFLRRFPKHELAPDCYLMQLALYYDLSSVEFQNPDIISFAELILNKFKQEYPREDRILEAEGILLSIEEAYARGFYETGIFYERTGRPMAAAIYYQTAIDRFPMTRTAYACNLKLNGLSVTPPQKKVSESIEKSSSFELDDEAFEGLKDI
ncbi:tetratricopeptide repeat protein [Criblamydia sequanensis]|uniref:Outer membrane lipoprotein BamD-like domain-containing protein n=1 Tax=Candidatus Criblamydia sequanensis CRIB-18 TaxID=1437425 RepID=A0A090DVN5_9BACT|nr:tetratricopeptide repeat protein [Criblamydia sequanensis]CDR33034.1 conserved hypothetical protein [Criblamydia sequanensis CRIB-18]